MSQFNANPTGGNGRNRDHQGRVRCHRHDRREAKHLLNFAVDRHLSSVEMVPAPIAAGVTLPDDSHPGWQRLARDLMAFPVVPDDGSDIGDRFDGLG